MSKHIFQDAEETKEASATSTSNDIIIAITTNSSITARMVVQLLVIKVPAKLFSRDGVWL